MDNDKEGSSAELRLDKWLWAARFFKTRSLAQKACNAGHVKCNGLAAKPARAVRVGDHLDVLTFGGRRLVDVLLVHGQRGPAAVARTLYDDKTPPELLERPREPTFVRDYGAGRPTKRERRQLNDWRGR